MRTSLGETGRSIWDAYGADGMDAGSRTLVLEFARCADLLEKLDGLARGERAAWAELVFDDMGEIHLSVDRVLDERRQHQLALKQLYGEMRMAGIRPQQGASSKGEVEDPEDMLTKRRMEREARERQLG